MKKLLMIFSAFVCCQSAVRAQLQHIAMETYGNQAEVTATGSITFKDGFVVPLGAGFRAYISAGSVPNLYTANKNFNYIIAHDVRQAGIVNPSDSNNLVGQVNTQVTYLDGQGRSVGTVAVKAGPGTGSIFQLKEYDETGLEKLQYLPYAKAGEVGLNRPSPIGLLDYYTTGANVVHTAYPFAGTRFEESPLRRVLEQGGPGDHWQLSTSSSPNKGHTLKYDMDTHRREALYKVAINATTGARTLTRLNNNKEVYPLDALVRTVVRDENSSSFSNYPGAVLESKNREGQVVVRRSYNQNGVTVDTLSTYYVYDDFGNLSFVLPPKANPDANAAIAQATLDNLCYQYRYDGRQRLIAKKLPGKGWDYMVYNKLDQMIMSQDANQRAKTPQQWSITKYDALGRVVLTGIYLHPNSAPNTDYLTAVQALANVPVVYWESRTSTGNGYTNAAFPTALATTLSINYYDDYNFPGGNPYPYTAGSVMTRSLPTGSRINVLGTAIMLWTVNYYDKEGRTVKSFKQHYKGGTLLAGNVDETTNTYGFTGAVSTSARSHKVNGTEQLKTLTEYDYDHTGRKTDAWETINSGPRILLSRLEYNGIGQLWKKNLHSTNGGTSFLQTITYAYNERGWLLNASAPKLDIKLRYQLPTKGGVAQYNGNISEMEYTSEKSANRWFKYEYDNINRLTASVYSTASELNETIAYDKMGNITSLKRGLAANAAIIYTYAANSNRLTGVTGGRTGTFTYDANGSAVTDGTRGVSLTYNMLNLPATVSGTKTATYTYNAGGKKLRSVQGTITRDYIGGLQYKNNALEFIATEEGRAVRNSNGSYRYEYTLKDHLGNARVSIDDNAGVARVVQEDEYYAFGLSKPRYIYGDKNNYLYNGKEQQDALADEYDYGARFYDPVIGRWNVVDAMADEPGQIDASPYAYAGNNPISRIDPDGNCWTCILPRSVAQAVGGVQPALTNRYNAVKTTVTNTYNATAEAVSSAGAAVQKFTAENKTSLLETAKGLQENGDKITTVGAVMAVMGAPVAGVGAAPGATVAAGGKLTSLVGAGLEIAVELVAGSNKNAAITATNEVTYEVLGRVGSKAIDQLIPGPIPDVSGQVKEATKQTMGFLEGLFKKETDKTIDKIK